MAPSGVRGVEVDHVNLPASGPGHGGYGPGHVSLRSAPGQDARRLSEVPLQREGVAARHRPAVPPLPPADGR